MSGCHYLDHHGSKRLVWFQFSFLEASVVRNLKGNNDWELWRFAFEIIVVVHTKRGVQIMPMGRYHMPTSRECVCDDSRHVLYGLLRR